MSLEANTDRAICSKCGTAYGRKKGNFSVCYGASYKGSGYLHICKDCIDKMYDSYLSQCNDSRTAVRQMCRKLDLFWSDATYDYVAKKAVTRSMMSQYISKVATVTYAGKSYDDTLSSEGTLWAFNGQQIADPEIQTAQDIIDEAADAPLMSIDDVPKDVIEFWGTGYEDNPNMYVLLEQRRQYWVDNLPDGIELDIGTQTVIRQICFLELDINRDRAAGKSIEKSVKALLELINNSILKPSQKKTEDVDSVTANTPLGVWLFRYENKRPLPEPDKEMRDVNRVLKYVFIWLGHVCKMLGKKNGFSRLYEEEMKKWRIEKPDYSDAEDDDEEFLTDVLDDEEESSLDI